MPAAAAEAGAVRGAGGPGTGALLQANTAHLQPLHHKVGGWMVVVVVVVADRLHKLSLRVCIIHTV